MKSMDVDQFMALSPEAFGGFQANQLKSLPMDLDQK